MGMPPNFGQNRGWSRCSGQKTCISLKQGKIGPRLLLLTLGQWQKLTHVGGKEFQPDRQWRSSSFRGLDIKVPVSRDLWPRSWSWAHPGCKPIWRPSCASLVAIEAFAREKKRFSWYQKSARITWPLTSTLTLSTSWMQARLGPSCASLVAIQPFVW